MLNGKMGAVIDEDLPRSVGVVLSELGWEVKEVRDTDLRGRSDDLVINFAKKHEAVLFSGDWGFANILNFPPRDYHGIVGIVLEVSHEELCAKLLRLFFESCAEHFVGRNTTREKN